MHYILTRLDLCKRLYILTPQRESSPRSAGPCAHILFPQNILHVDFYCNNYFLQIESVSSLTWSKADVFAQFVSQFCIPIHE